MSIEVTVRFMLPPWTTGLLQFIRAERENYSSRGLFRQILPLLRPEFIFCFQRKNRYYYILETSSGMETALG